MNIATLTLIHNLLIENLNRTKGALEIAQKKHNQAIDNDAPNQKTLEELKNKIKNKYWSAKYALEEFEQKEWK